MTLRPILQSDPEEAEWLLLRSTELDTPPSDGKARLLMALGVGAGAAATATTAGAAAAASKGVLSSSAVLAAKWLGIGALGGVVVAGAAELASRAPSDESTAEARFGLRRAPASTDIEAPRVAPQPFAEMAPTNPTALSEPKAIAPATASTAPAAAVTMQRAPAYERQPPPAPPPGPSIGKFPEGTLADEIALIDAARSALGAGDPGRCLSMLQTHGVRFTTPRLSPEVRVLRIEALVALGKWEEARRLGREFLASHPGSTHVQRVRTLLGGDSAPR